MTDHSLLIDAKMDAWRERMCTDGFIYVAHVGRVERRIKEFLQELSQFVGCSVRFIVIEDQSK